MSAFENIGLLLAGIAIFLLGMNFMEETLRTLGGRSFKLFLRKQTAYKLRAVGGGAIATGILQSSSVINLLVLALVGAGIIQLQNALAVTLGSNLGTTIGNWIVVSVGFKFDLNNIIFPLAGISGISLAFFSPDSRNYQWCRFILGFSFLFIGLALIKSGMGELVTQIDLQAFNKLPLFAFFLIGILLTAIIQSSSTTVALTLSALYADIIPLPSAMSIVLGSEIGTTLKLFVASAGGAAVKKQVALGNFLINLITGLLVLSLLPLFHRFVLYLLNSPDDLIALVFFQSLVNITAILLFYPFLEFFARFLSKRYKKKNNERYINKVSPAETLLAEKALEKETLHFLNQVLLTGYSVLEGKPAALFGIPNPKFLELTALEKYQYLKTYHGEIHSYYSKLLSGQIDKPSRGKIEQLASAVRNGMYAAKSLKDIFSDIEQLKNSSKDTKYNHYLQMRQKFLRFSETASDIISSHDRTETFSKLLGLYQHIQQSYGKELSSLYQTKGIDDLTDQEISTLLNFNREIFTYYKSILFALKDAYLDEEQAARFDELPGFIR